MPCLPMNLKENKKKVLKLKLKKKKKEKKDTARLSFEFLPTEYFNISKII